MWLFPTLGALGRCYRECQRSRGVFSYEHFQTWGPSVPVAIVTGFFCAYVWVRIRPYFTDDPDELQQVADSHDFKDVRTFLNGLHEQMIDMWYATFGWTRNPRPRDTNRNGKQIQELKHQTRSSTTETISKEGEDMLLSKRPTDGEMRSQLTESILGTMAFKSHVAREDVTTLKQRLNDMSGGQVHQVAETSYVLQTRLPITPDLLTEALALAQYGAALDPQCTLQLGSWGIIVHRGQTIHGSSVVGLAKGKKNSCLSMHNTATLSCTEAVERNAGFERLGAHCSSMSLSLAQNRNASCSEVTRQFSVAVICRR